MCEETFHHCFMEVSKGKKEHAKSLHLASDCAGFCTLSARLIARHSPLMVHSCAACAEACKATAAEVDDFNDKGSRGETVARVGLGVMVAGLVLTGLTGYKGFVGGKKEEGVALAPSVGPHGAGASLTLRW